MNKGQIGIGQLFRSLNGMPTFELLNAGRAEAPPRAEGGQRDSAEDGLWRVYDLRSQHLNCRIHEDFAPGFLSLHASS